MDFLRAEKRFKEYVANFKVADEKVNIKIVHTFGVIMISEYIAKDLNLSEEDLEIAKLIALLHDIGRFEQAVKFNNFNDYETMDHAEYGVKVLFDGGLIRDFINTDKYKKKKKKAIYNHNKFNIEEGLSDRELLHSKIIRDADKTDNFMIKPVQDLGSLLGTNEAEVEKSQITDLVWEEFLNKNIITSSHRKTSLDKWFSTIAWIYDYNFAVALKYLEDNNCIDKIIDRFDYKDKDTKEKMEYARRVAKDYIKERISDLSEDV